MLSKDWGSFLIHQLVEVDRPHIEVACRAGRSLAQPVVDALGMVTVETLERLYHVTIFEGEETNRALQLSLINGVDLAAFEFGSHDGFDFPLEESSFRQGSVSHLLNRGRIVNVDGLRPSLPHTAHHHLRHRIRSVQLLPQSSVLVRSSVLLVEFLG